MELISAELTGASQLLFGLAWVDPGETHLRHHHPDLEEIYYVLEGEADFSIGDATVRGSPGTAIFIPPGTSHRIRNDGPVRVTFCWAFGAGSLTDVNYTWDE